MTNWALAEWYRVAWPAAGKGILDYRNTGSPGTLVEGTSPLSSGTGKVRYTGTGWSTNYNSATANSAFITAGGNYTLLLWETDPGKLLTLQFDGGNTGGDYSVPGYLPSNPNGKLVWVDYSAVVWEPAE
jgi:hypothetical protein